MAAVRVTPRALAIASMRARRLAEKRRLVGTVAAADCSGNRASRPAGGVAGLCFILRASVARSKLAREPERNRPGGYAPKPRVLKSGPAGLPKRPETIKNGLQ
jgi:hypothetical protein